ncbi:adenylyl-sulfate kinase [Conexibacter sp. CPCC 206217]|uniref:adenylyl-sulfate kinase n=1 Tax=Conexibacter sp. CPCC 206217 TaxID=3064574 RepID=UPI002728B9C7|nr:adenylyl-sulfate kinase [Conexibacter sp. CPCC 206217]MDO8209580.1 adenylyl-sulfate kinase [Conexibacter sp. CPCC 206217]
MRSDNVTWHEGSLSREQRWDALGRSGATIWLTGLPGAGKTTLAQTIEAALLKAGRPAYRLDATTLRDGVCSDLGYSSDDRKENNRRLAELARLFGDAGTIAIIAAVSPFAEGRSAARRVHEQNGIPFIEVFVNTPLAVCVERDPSGIYHRAIDRDLRDVPGFDLTYEPPLAPEVEVTPDVTPTRALDLIAAALHAQTGAPAFDNG